MAQGMSLRRTRCLSAQTLWALKKAGVSGVIAVGTVGGAAPDMGPGRIAVPDQLLDYTWGREVTYYDDFGAAGMKHVDMTWPFDRALSAALVKAAERLGRDVRTTASTPARRDRDLKRRPR